MKDQFDSYYAEKYTVKERNKVWENIAKKYQTIFQPFIEFINRQDPDSSGHKEMNHNYSNVLPPEKLGRASSADNSIVLNHAIKEYQGAQIT